MHGDGYSSLVRLPSRILFDYLLTAFFQRVLSPYVYFHHDSCSCTNSRQIVLALIAFFILPNFPRTTSWLSEQEKQMAVWRLQEDIGEDDWVNAEEQTFFHGAKLAVKDPKAWLLLATIYGFTSSGTVTTLFPSVVEGLGYGKVATLLLTVPPYVSDIPRVSQRENSRFE